MTGVVPEHAASESSKQSVANLTHWDFTSPSGSPPDVPSVRCRQCSVMPPMRFSAIVAFARRTTFPANKQTAEYVDRYEEHDRGLARMR
jgi:hypothetical protein